MKKSTMAKSIAASLLLAAGAANAGWHVNVGAINVSPDESSNAITVLDPSIRLGVDSDTQLGITIDYDYSENVVFELVAATPFTHELSVATGSLGGNDITGLAVGETKQLPPTLLAQYHFGSAEQKLRPFVGAGINYTIFFEENLHSLNTALDNKGALSLDLDASVGLALQAGANYKINNNWGIHAMAMWADISAEGDIIAAGNSVQKVDVELDPLVLMVGVRYSF